MTELVLVLSTALVAGIPAYVTGRMVGEERGRMDAYRKVAELNRRLRERGMR